MLSRLYGVLLPFFVSFLIAYLLDPVVNFVQNKCKVKFRGLSVTIVLLLFVGILTLSVYLLIPAIGREVQAGRPVWVTLLCMALVFIIVQTLQDMVLTPKIMGKVTGMGPAAILLSLSIWGALFGVIGMIIALPLTTLIISYYKHYIAK